jgi:hypothetical protein
MPKKLAVLRLLLPIVQALAGYFVMRRWYLGTAMEMTYQILPVRIYFSANAPSVLVRDHVLNFQQPLNRLLSVPVAEYYALLLPVFVCWCAVAYGFLSTTSSRTQFARSIHWAKAAACGVIAILIAAGNKEQFIRDHANGAGLWNVTLIPEALVALWVLFLLVTATRLATTAVHMTQPKPAQ